MNQQDDPLTYQVIGRAMQVHREIGPGLDEILYHKRLGELLTVDRVPFDCRPRRKLLHRGQVADLFECDLLVRSSLVVELKVLYGAFPPESFAQIFCYLKAWNAPTGLLVDFGKESLIQRRVTASFPASPTLVPLIAAGEAPEFVADRPLLITILKSVQRVLETHGLGYRDVTYQNLISADLRIEQVPHLLRPVATVKCDDNRLGDCECDCILVNNAAAILTLALRDEITAADRAILQTYLKHLRVPWGVVVNFGKKQPEIRYVSAPTTRLV